MTYLFRLLRLLAIAAWFGGLVFFGIVTAVAFGNLPDAHLAGIIVRGSLSGLHHLGLIAGGIYFLFTLLLLATQRDSHPARAVELALVVSMLALTAYSQFSIMPRMEADRATLGGDVQKGQSSNPEAYRHFERLHGVSVKLEGAILIEAIILLALAPIRGREDFDRFA